MKWPERIEVIDSHTEGEPTRVVVSGWELPAGETLAQKRDTLRREQDALRKAVVCEPRGHDALVGALLTPPVTPGAVAGVIFFNNAGVLGMCGHGLIGLVRTLEKLDRVKAGRLRIDTPVGTVGAELHPDGAVTVENVPARCAAQDVALDLPGLGRVVGDVAWGGNWFFLTTLAAPTLELAHVGPLTDATARILRALAQAGITGDGGAPIDHVELFGPAQRPDAHSRNFVLCPGLAYDRSPCGTGTSAKMACLHARGKLRAGESWRQESITGSLFEGHVEERGGELIPFVRGRAFVTGQSTLYFAEADPFREGFTAFA
ncbi:MAG TPA: proline racemase family protein [Vicinamibacteria bacterium]